MWAGTLEDEFAVRCYSALFEEKSLAYLSYGKSLSANNTRNSIRSIGEKFPAPYFLSRLAQLRQRNFGNAIWATQQALLVLWRQN